MSGGPPRGLGVVGKPSQRDGKGPDELLEGWETSGGSLGGPCGVVRGQEASQGTVRGWEDFPECREGLGGPPEGSGGIEMPTWRTVRGWEELREGQAGSGVYSRVPGGVKRHSRRVRRGRESPQEGWER